MIRASDLEMIGSGIREFWENCLQEYWSFPKMIAETTLYRLYTMCLPISHKKHIIKWVGGDPLSIRLLLEQHFYVESMELYYLKHCPKCVKEDIKLFGTPYWHRSHCCKFSFVCHKHSCMALFAIKAESTFSRRPEGFRNHFFVVYGCHLVFFRDFPLLHETEPSCILIKTGFIETGNECFLLPEYTKPKHATATIEKQINIALCDLLKQNKEIQIFTKDINFIKKLNNYKHLYIRDEYQDNTPRSWMNEIFSNTKKTHIPEVLLALDSQ